MSQVFVNSLKAFSVAIIRDEATTHCTISFYFELVFYISRLISLEAFPGLDNK